jgi:glyoxylase-like metal-dependent hydrolase (beta-lactamase superfamily II)
LSGTTITPIPLGPCTSYLLRGEGAVLVDAGMPGDERRILQALAAADLGPGDIAAIIVTHCHIDHVGGLAKLKELTGATIAVGRADADWLRTGTSPVLRPRSTAGRVLSTVIRPKPYPAVEPDLPVDQELPLELFGLPGRIVATPGHTPGSVSIVLDGREAIVGDLLMAMVSPRRPTLPIFADDLEQVKTSIRTLLQMGCHRFYLGHGGPCEAELVRRLVG